MTEAAIILAAVLAHQRSIFPPHSKVLAGLAWQGASVAYRQPEKKGDTFPKTWAADGNLYTSAGDPCRPNKAAGLDVERFVGDAPDFTIEQVNTMPGYRGAGGEGPKPTGFIAIKGTLYLAFQNLTHKFGPYEHGYDAQVVASTDYGKTWTPDIADLEKSGNVMFPGRTFGSPAFVNTGKDDLKRRDGIVYAISGESWDNGDHCRLARVPSNRIMDRSAWEWVKGFTALRSPVWSHEMNAAVPVPSVPGFLGTVDMVYIAKLKRYLLFTWHHKVKSDPDHGSELLVLDAPKPWGPFTTVYHEDQWETREMNPYNPRLPLKWFDQETLTGRLLFSGSWRNGGQTPFYRAHVRKFRLLRVRE